MFMNAEIAISILVLSISLIYIFLINTMFKIDTRTKLENIVNAIAKTTSKAISLMVDLYTLVDKL